jgi:putative toxin-antitoxin system antitoxin component (TIGR02293 family)
MGHAATVGILGFELSNQTPIEIVEHGLPYGVVERLTKALDLTLDEFCHIVPVSRRTLSRYRTGQLLDAHLSDHILVVSQVYDRAVEVLESPESAKIWLKTPNYTFRGQRPLDYLHSFAGSQEVLDELVRLQYGVFV